MIRKKELDYCLNLKNIRPALVFGELFGDMDKKTDKGEQLEKYLSNIAGSSSQIHNFLQLIYRTEDIKLWEKFIEHENIKNDSKWKHDLLKEIAGKFKGWLDKEYVSNNIANVVDNELDSILYELTDGAPPQLSRKTYRVWRLELLRRAFREPLQEALSRKQA